MATVHTFVNIPNPEGLVFNVNGNLYVTNDHSNISTIDTSGVQTVIASTIGAGRGLAFNQSGDLYVANNADNFISKIDSLGNLSMFVSTPNPNGVAVDSLGNIYIANESNNTISKADPSGNISVFVSSGLSRPQGVAFDSLGNLYVANAMSKIISKIDTTGNNTPFVPFTFSPNSVAFDSNDNLYVSGGGRITKVTPLGIVTTFVNIDSPTGLAFDQADNLYVASVYANKISVIYSTNITTGAQLIDFMGDSETDGNLVNDVEISEDLVSLTGIYKNILSAKNTMVNIVRITEPIP